MINVLNLAELMAAELGFPVPSAQVIARFGREAGMISTGGRGRNVRKATSMDASHLLIAMLSGPSPSKSVEYMRDFGDLVLMSGSEYGKRYEETLRKYFTKRMTFRESVATLLDIIGNKSFAKYVAPKYGLACAAGREDHTKHAPWMQIEISESELTASIEFGDDARLGFHHASMGYLNQEFLDAVDPDHRARLRKDAWADVNKTKSKYEMKIKSNRYISTDVILAIGKILNGISLDEIIQEYSKRKIAKLKTLPVEEVTNPLLEAMFAGTFSQMSYEEQEEIVRQSTVSGPDFDEGEDDENV